MITKSQPDILFFKTETDGHPLGYSYVTIAKDKIKIEPGDHLEYDIFIDITSPLSQAGVEVHFASGRCMRESFIMDQNDMWSHPMTNLFDAVESWYHRSMELNTLVGEVVDSVEVAFVSPIPGTYIACFKNIVLTRQGKPIHSFYATGAPKVIESKMTISYFNDVIKAIRWEDFRKTKLEHIDPSRLSPEIQLAEKLATLEPENKSQWQPLIERAKARLDVKKYIEHDDRNFQKSLHETAKILAPILQAAKTFTTHFIGHAHIDMNWLWVWDETLAVCLRDFETMAKLMEKYPFFTFSQSQVSIYKAVMKARPDLFERIKYFVNRGQWEITAAMWVEGDENMASGEALVRQFLLANRFLKRHFGKEPKVCWQPDLFGHVATMPQILNRCGVEYYYFMRCGKDNPHVFFWEGPDGSRVIAATTPNYNGSIGNDTVNYGFELYRKQGVKDYMHVYGVGDHGGGPTMRDIERGLELKNNPNLPSVKFSTIENYFNSVAATDKNLPVIHDELQFIFEGCYTTHADIKLRNRQCENLFPVLEIFSALAMPFELPYPNYILSEGWERTCFNQFHDILPGSAIHATYEEACPITDGFLAAGKNALQKSLATLAQQIDTSQFDGNGIVVFNPTSWNRTDVVIIELPLFSNEWAKIFDDNGQEIPSQITHRHADKAEVVFIAEHVPSIGYKTFRWNKVQQKPRYQTQLSVTDNMQVENEFYRIQIDQKSGCLKSLVIKATERELIQSGKFANVFQLLHEDGREMSAWQIGKILATHELLKPDRIELIETGPVRAKIQISHRHNESTFIQNMIVYHNLPRIDFPCTVDWREIGTRETGSQFLKVAFPFNLGAESQATFEIPFGTIQREANGHEYPSQKWMDVSDENFGVSLVNDCKYGCDVDQNVMRLSLLRCSYEPDPLPDQGMHQFTYAIAPHQKDWKQANTIRCGYEFNQPFIPMVTDRHKGRLPLSGSFVSCSAENVIITAFKKSEDDDALILRCYETQGKSCETQFRFSFNILQIRETDLLERDLDDASLEIKNNSFHVEIEPYEIRTFRIKREGFQWQKRHNFVPV